jgi:murein L,D-transpeptidase YafK
MPIYQKCKSSRADHWSNLAVILICLMQICGCVPNSIQDANNDVTPIIHNLKDKGVVWLSINTKEKSLTIFNGQTSLRRFSRIALGSAGAGIKRKRGDNITPIGEFKVASIRPSARFRWFIALSYPSVEYAQRGQEAGLIDNKMLSRIRSTFINGDLPPQNTALGGNIGIHGLGGGSLETHHLLNWTDGCIALDNEQIEALVKMVKPKMLVEIQ